MDDEDHDSETADIAAIMGFGSFGNAPLPKKRKIEHPPEASSTGANSMSLGIRQRKSDRAQEESVVEDTAAGEEAISTSQPRSKREKKAKSVGGGLAAYLSRGQALPDASATTTTSTTTVQPVADTRSDASTISSVPSTDSVLSKSLADLSQEDLWSLKKGVRDAQRQVVYFQPSFIEDPWAQNAAHRTSR